MQRPEAALGSCSFLSVLPSLCSSPYINLSHFVPSAAPVGTSAVLKARGEAQIRASLCSQKHSPLTPFSDILHICFPWCLILGRALWKFVSHEDSRKYVIAVSRGGWWVFAEQKPDNFTQAVTSGPSEASCWAVLPGKPFVSVAPFSLELVQEQWECCCEDLWLFGNGSLSPPNLALAL